MVIRKHKCGVQKRGGWYLENRRVVFRKEEGGIQKIGGWY